MLRCHCHIRESPTINAPYTKNGLIKNVEVSEKFCIASNLRNKNPGNESLKTKCCRLLKEYQSTCKANQKRFFQNQVDTFYSTDNSNLWKNWKNCGDKFEAKMPTLKNGTVWERYYKDLFRDNNFVPGNDLQQNEVFISQKKLND